MNPITSALVRARHSLGDFELTVCTDGTYLLDGGAMFGVVPKTLWQKRIPANSDNQILLGLNTVVVRTGKHTVVIETGIGNKQPPKMREIFKNQELLPASLAAAGIDPAKVDIVINTHLHFDHCGWNTTLHADGSVTPTFPNARYFAHAGEVAHGHLQLDRDRVSYLSPNYDPLIAVRPDDAARATRASARIRRSARASRSSSSPATQRRCSASTLHRRDRSSHVRRLIACTSRLLHRRPDPDRASSGSNLGDGLRSRSAAIHRGAQALLLTRHPREWLVLFTHDHDTPMAQIRTNDKGKPVIRG